MKVSEMRELIDSNDGEVTDVGYTSVGWGKKAFIEAYFESVDSIPVIDAAESDDDVTVDDDWDAENNGVMFEVVISRRDEYSE